MRVRAEHATEGRVIGVSIENGPSPFASVVMMNENGRQVRFVGSPRELRKMGRQILEGLRRPSHEKDNGRHAGGS